ncbi:MAG: metallophosphoesterase [Firmicutes bacterium]|nr:metallophosphoesterase [Bacillota bacterium]MDY6161370.1 metallophosphoesterase [Candidatus Faecousia sp.]
MKILVFSDSHSSRRFMRQCVDVLQPDGIIHLGDMVQDGEVLSEEYPQLPYYQVAGNCDRGRVVPGFPEIRVEELGGVRIYMTHGHLQGVKLYLDKLILDAQRCRADVILYGHTHEPDCRRLPEGQWIMNPGSAGYGGTAGLILIEGGSAECRIVRQRDMEEAL